MMCRLPGLIGAVVLLVGLLGVGSGCTPTDRNFASGGAGGAGGAGGSGCPAGFAECDGNPDTVCETDTNTDAAHCGTCDQSCKAVVDGNIACVAGMCAITSCNNGRENCDNFYDNGCETNPSTNFDHCGGCGQSCEDPTAITACVSGKCQLAQCVGANLDCDMNASNGCEVDPASNADHCGACDKACMGANATMGCMNSLCAIASCNPNFGDCNMMAMDGCETDLMTNPHHCTTCGNSCGGGLCNAGVCNPPILVAKSPFSPAELVLFKDALFIGARTASGEIASVPAIGGTPQVLGTSSAGAVLAMAVNSAGIFIGGTQGIARMDVDGAKLYNYGLGTSRGVAADLVTLYFSTSSTIRMAPTAGGATTTLLNGQNGIHGMTLDSNILYWGLQDGSIYSSPTSMPAAVKRAAGPTTAANVVTDATNVYWSSSQGIHFAPKGGGTTTTLAKTSANVRAIAIDATHVYYTDETDGEVRRVLKDGSSTSELMALDQPMPWGIAVDSNFVYWANGATNDIWKLPK